MKPWLRRNWIGLIAVGVLVPATVGITFANEWTEYFGGRPSAPTSVAAGDTVDFADSGFVLRDSRRIPAASAEGEKIGLPAGSDLVVVTVSVTPDGEAPGCIVRLEEFDGAAVTRSWGDSSFDPIDFTATEGTKSYCATDEAGPYLLESVFVVASDAGDDLAVALTVASELPRYLSLRL